MNGNGVWQYGCINHWVHSNDIRVDCSNKNGINHKAEYNKQKHIQIQSRFLI